MKTPEMLKIINEGFEKIISVINSDVKLMNEDSGKAAEYLLRLIQDSVQIQAFDTKEALDYIHFLVCDAVNQLENISKLFSLDAEKTVSKWLDLMNTQYITEKDKQQIIKSVVTE